ncbi:glycoside hydrolase family 20 zincin-like fold domain-containing protein [Kribbella deserti]|uniref:Glycoside hydrolase family 20 zincin-like fold domain-containing protein n=1 Tax=Kribbella deserti TaxID=1926257 RepID=A0ABV6QEI0_9ACTN
MRASVVPALREWTAASGSYEFGPASRIAIGSSALSTAAGTLATDLQALLGTRPQVLVGAPAAGDIQLILGDPDAALATQGYRLTSGPALTVAARTETGVFHGTRSVLQLLRQATTIPAGTGRDWPAHPERGILIDNKPRHFSVAWFTNLIKDLSYLKLNELMLFGWKLTDAEISQLNQVARAYHVHITPLLGMPSWTEETLIAERPDLALDLGGPTPVNAAFDFTKPGALDYAKQWIERYIDKFDGPYWHTGADEFLGYPGDVTAWNRYPQFAAFARAKTGNPGATGPDAYKWFINWVNDIVKAHGKITRVWNDGLEATNVVQLNTDIVIEHWVTPGGRTPVTPQQFAEAGHQVYNFNSEYLYYDNGWRHIDPAIVYNEFTVDHFAGDDVYVTGPAKAKLQGARFAVWNDGLVESNEEIAANLFAPLRSLAQVVWGTPKSAANYQGFEPLVRALGRAPGWQSTGGDVTGDPVALRDKSGRLTWFARTASGQLRHGWQHQPGGDWTEQAILASGIEGKPAVLTQGEALTYIARKTNGDLIAADQVGPGSFTTPTTIGAGAVSDPVTSADGSSYVVLKAGGALHHGRRTATGWTSTVVANGIVSVPATAVDTGGRLAIAARTSAGGLLIARQTSTGWRTSTVLTGVAGDPALIRAANGALSYFARTATGGLEHGTETSTGWSAPVHLADGVSGNPKAIEDLNDRMTYFVRLGSGELLHGWQRDPGRGPWHSAVLADRVAGDPALSEDAALKLTYFVTGVNGELIHGWQDSAGNGPWHRDELWNNIAGTPVPVLDISGTQTYFATASYGHLLHGWENAVGHTGDDWSREVLVGRLDR